MHSWDATLDGMSHLHAVPQKCKQVVVASIRTTDLQEAFGVACPPPISLRGKITSYYIK